MQLKDRSKDIIISGGENISSIEVEDALYRHPAVQAAAVVARPDEKWGETPCAVEVKPGETVTAELLIIWCCSHLASYKCRRHCLHRTAEDLGAQVVDSLQHSRVELAMAYDFTLEGWSRAVDLRDHETENHTKRIVEMTVSWPGAGASRKKTWSTSGVARCCTISARWASRMDPGQTGPPG